MSCKDGVRAVGIVTGHLGMHRPTFCVDSMDSMDTQHGHTAWTAWTHTGITEGTRGCAEEGSDRLLLGEAVAGLAAASGSRAGRAGDSSA